MYRLYTHTKRLVVLQSVTITHVIVGVNGGVIVVAT